MKTRSFDERCITLTDQETGRTSTLIYQNNGSFRVVGNLAHGSNIIFSHFYLKKMIAIMEEFIKGDHTAPDQAPEIMPEYIEPEPEYCRHCNGYGSSLKEDQDICSKCNGSGLKQ